LDCGDPGPVIQLAAFASSPRDPESTMHSRSSRNARTSDTRESKTLTPADLAPAHGPPELFLDKAWKPDDIIEVKLDPTGSKGSAFRKDIE
jgi:hypothetical protein